MQLTRVKRILCLLLMLVLTLQLVPWSLAFASDTNDAGQTPEDPATIRADGSDDSADNSSINQTGSNSSLNDGSDDSESNGDIQDDIKGDDMGLISISQSQNYSLCVYLYKSDEQTDSTYVLSGQDKLLAESYTIGASESSHPTMELTLSEDSSEESEWLDMKWQASGDKMMRELFSEDDMLRLGVWDSERLFRVWDFVLTQDGEQIGQYLLFVFEDPDQDALQYVFAQNTFMIEHDDLSIIIDQYKNDNAEFVDTDILTAEEIRNVCAVLKGSLEILDSGYIRPDADINARIDLFGPQKMPSQEDVIDDAEEVPEVLDIEKEDGVIPMPENKDEPLLMASELMPETRRILKSGMGNMLTSTAPPVQTPVTADGITITKLTTRWMSASTGSMARAGFDPLVLAPESMDFVPNQQWQIDFVTAGKGDIEAGDIEITIPAYIWLDANGKEPGQLTLAIPEEPDTGNDFAWKRIDDCVVITNTRQISAGSKYMLQGTFRMTYPDPNADHPFTTTYAHEMIGERPENTPEQDYDLRSNDFYAEINVITPRTREVLNMTSNSIYATLDTHAEVASATKSVVTNGVYSTVPSAMPADMRPDNPSDYIYVKWYVDGTAKGNQSFVMTFEDDLSSTGYKVVSGSRVEIPLHGVILGVVGLAGGNVVVGNDDHTEATLFHGYSSARKTAYVWVAYPKTDFPEEDVTYIMPNTQTVHVAGIYDQVDSTKSATSEARYIRQSEQPIPPIETPAMRDPITWTIDKVWSDNDNADGHRPEQLRVWIENATTGRVVFSTYLNDGNNWHAEWTDDGLDYRYQAYEHSYAVSRSTVYSLLSGNTDWVYYENGTKERILYGYRRAGTRFNNETHTWTFTNEYYTSTERIESQPTSITKTAINHTNSGQKATSDSDLALLRKGQKTTALGYAVKTHVFCMEYTSDLYQPIGSPERYHAKYVTVELSDDNEYLQSRHLAYDDYQIEYVMVNTPVFYRWNPSGGELASGEMVASEAMPVSILGQSEDGAWVEYAVLADNVLTAQNGAAVNGKTVTFPTTVHRVKASTRTNAAAVDLSYNLGVTINPTQDIQNDVEALFLASDYAMARSTNYATVTIVNASNEAVMSLTRSATTYLHGRNYKVAVNLTKDTSFLGNDKSARLFRMSSTLTLTQQSNITTLNDYKQSVAARDISVSKSGTFYDLLPLGVSADLSSVTCTNGTVKTASIIENYKDTGRQMVVIKVLIGNGYQSSTSSIGGTYPADGYGSTTRVTFKSTYPYEDALNLGLNGITNYAAYEADEDDFGDIQYWRGERDEPSGANHNKSTVGIDPSVYGIMTDLDPERDTPSFVYAKASLRITEVDFSALTDIRKMVQVLGSDKWSYGHDNDVNVYEGGKYTYRIQLSSSLDTRTKDIIILDKLEDYTLNPSDMDYDENGQWSWKGSFRSIDVSEMRAIGVEPVVYYYTQGDLDIYNLNPMDDYTSVPSVLTGSGWSTTVPADPGDVKAIAIDCRYTPDGEAFVLEEGQVLIAKIYMQAPTYDDAPDKFDPVNYKDHLMNAHAYNNVFMDVTQIDDLGLMTHGYSHFDYTKVGIMGWDIDVQKYWSDMNDNDRMRPESVTIHLYANEEDTGLSAIMSGPDWEHTFPHTRKFDDDGNQIYYTIVEDPVPEYSYTSRVNIESGRIELTNTHDPVRVEVPYQKVWLSDEPAGWEGNIPASITIRLLKDGVYTGQSQVLRAGIDGNWTGSFKNLLKYDNGRIIEYGVEEIPIADFQMYQTDNLITNIYYPYGDLSITKTVENGTAAANNQYFTFTVDLEDSNGGPLTEKYHYSVEDELGTVVRVGEMGNGDELLLKHGEKCIIKDLPSRARYVIAEQPKPGFTNTASLNSAGQIVSNSEVASSFINEYASFGQVALRASKTLTGRMLEKYQFRFAVLDEYDNELRLATNALDGSITFGSIRYSEADDGIEHVYTMHEINTGKAGYTYDDSIITIKVTPHDNGDGTLTCEAVYYNADNEVITLPEFHNSYEASGDITLRAWKVMPQRTLQNEEFEFEFLNEDEEVIETVRNQADGSVVFSTLHFTEADVGKTLKYIVREKPGTDETVVYDANVYGYQVIPVDNGDGTLSFLSVPITPVYLADPCTECNNGTHRVMEKHAVSGGIITDVRNDFFIMNLSFLNDGDAPAETVNAFIARFNTLASISEETVLDAGENEVHYIQKAEYEGSDSELMGILDELLGYNCDAWDSRLAEEIGDSIHIVLSITPELSGGVLVAGMDFIGDADCKYCDGTGVVHELIDWSLDDAELPVFRNMLKNGALAITKQVTADDPSKIDPEQEFEFEIRFIGDDLDDGHVWHYKLEKTPEETEDPGEQEP